MKKPNFLVQFYKKIRYAVFDRDLLILACNTLFTYLFFSIRDEKLTVCALNALRAAATDLKQRSPPFECITSRGLMTY